MDDNILNAEPVTATPISSADVAKSQVAGGSSLPVGPATLYALLRELLCIASIVVVADVSIYRSQVGYTGVAVFLLLAPLLLLAGQSKATWSRRGWLFLLLALIWIVAARLCWYGSPLTVASGLILFFGFAVARVGGIPYVPSSLFMALQVIPGAWQAILHYAGSLGETTPRVPKLLVVNIGLPIVALTGFGTLFVLANPDVRAVITSRLGAWWDVAAHWLNTVDTLEVFFWGVTGVLVMGLLRPLIDFGHLRLMRAASADRAATVQPAPLFTAFRNTTVAVIALFTVYLIFEFATLWFRDFPDGFYYAGYAHEGAAWLTVALALVTCVLSLIFRGAVLQDPRLATLRRLAWVWSSLNFVLALAVYNRLFIYIGFNGLTRMRIVGLFGISVVVAGFLLVVWKIARDKDLEWLLQRQFWALAVSVLLFSVTPVDAVAVRYNAARVQAGDLSACVQIGVHRINTEGILMLPYLVDCEDPIIQHGVRALMAREYSRLENVDSLNQNTDSADGDAIRSHWAHRQLAKELARQRLSRLEQKLAPFSNPAIRNQAIQDFYEYAYQWY